MVTILAGLALLAPLGQEGVERRVRSDELIRDPAKGQTALIRTELDPHDPAKKSPMKFGPQQIRWEFPWLVQGYTRTPGAPQYGLRFRIYSQDRKSEGDHAPRVARMLTAIWEENATRLRIDHPDRYNGRIVDVYLCWGGKAGGEQRFGIDFENGIQKSVNTIYFYDLNSFTDPIETAREIAHEYGHASLPAIGGYEAPEDWANGYLGEKLYLRWLRDSAAAGHLTTEDTMGASKAQLDAWVTKNVDPLVVTASQTLPTGPLLADRSAAGMDRYIGLALYAATVLPESVFSRSLLLTGSTEAKDYPESIAMAAEEPEEYTLRIPPYLRGRTLWIPLNKAKISGAKVLRFVGKWAKIQPTTDTVVITNQRP
ncbi:MAG: hypothetical protein ACO1SV_26705 [Fimbriimonas sp.]